MDGLRALRTAILTYALVVSGMGFCSGAGLRPAEDSIKRIAYSLCNTNVRQIHAGLQGSQLHFKEHAMPGKDGSQCLPPVILPLHVFRKLAHEEVRTCVLNAIKHDDSAQRKPRPILGMERQAALLVPERHPCSCCHALQLQAWPSNDTITLAVAPEDPDWPPAPRM